MSAAAPEDGDEPVPTTEADTRSEDAPNKDNPAEPDAEQESNISDDQWQAFGDLLQAVYDFRTDEGHDPSHVFHRKVNKRLVPTYYEVITEPIAMSTIKTRLHAKSYKDPSDVVRDFALIPHNAQVFNRPDAGAYQDALTIKALLEAELKKLVDRDLITSEQAELPYLGEIPAVEDSTAAAEGGEEEEEEEADEDEEGEESDASASKRKGRKAGRKTKVEKEEADEADDADPLKKKRGRPPRVDTPTESRIKNILKAVRRIKGDDGVAKTAPFERLPDKAAMPEYYNEIKDPMAIDTIRKRVKRKKYQYVEQFMKDLNLMFDNAKLYNEDSSQLFKDAVALQADAQRLAEEELAKPDTVYVMEDGRIPLPEGIMHNGELYKIGDWVHIQNPNDLTKPIVSQIYRTWQDAAGAKFINACWYYRPEQTVHRFDKHFFPHEIVKTGQYRDHPIDEIVDRCFVMFVTRFSKGRPRSLPADKSIYVCESRYNEEKHTFNKIKTWASCLPDEVRDKDYEMEMYNEPKRMKKVPSPIAYLLKDEQKETDDFPTPQWGSENAPPKIGAVHRRPRNPKDSPPPEPTPPPPVIPPPPPPVAQTPTNFQQSRYTNLAPGASRTANTPITPMPGAMLQPRTNYPPNNMNTLPRTTPNARGAYAQGPATHGTPRQPAMNATNYGIGSPANPPRGPPGPGATPVAAVNPTAQGYQAPQPVEVYRLSEALNAAIPGHVREQFACDSAGNVLFFTAPPLALDPEPADQPGDDNAELPLAHSARYLAAMKRRREARVDKRKRDEAAADEAAFEARKAARVEVEDATRRFGDVADKARAKWAAQMQDENEALFKRTFGEESERLLSERPWVTAEEA